ncbi:response regulator [Bradyrhizobium sp. CCBAU 53380]|uniref:response regulator n=1 Tax=Bradyrhizobium sp. CCBAU 53380 TaxID=1325117 RepID=UPI0023023D42|nr:response regulator [Bradyrhizobium sp. CCBAU 53380]MDA9427130.1 hypothetical protein [Bradyrhizobium sp. CCBAU 53380]
MSASELRGCRDLVIEDEYFLASDLEKALKSHGAQIVGPVAELDVAYQLAKQDHFDVAVIDIKLHDEMAYPIADELVRQGIFSTGYEPRFIPKRFEGTTVWQKPFDPQELVRDVDRLFRIKQTHRRQS